MRGNYLARRPLVLALFALGAGACIADVIPTRASVCTVHERRCQGNVPQVCDQDWQWQDQPACSGSTSYCDEGACVSPPPSCTDLLEDCGPERGGCCASPHIPGGTFTRIDNDGTLHPATVSGFRLDRFEVTVGRFRQFVNAYPNSRPTKGAGAHPRIANSGWEPTWDTLMPAAHDDLIAAIKCQAGSSTWTDDVGDNEDYPMNCVDWYVAFAFCAWDGGRLPTEAEWYYAAAGGAAGREYPWGAAPPDTAHAVYCMDPSPPDKPCLSLNIHNIEKVGSKSPTGDGLWHQADLAGNIWEWTLDANVPYDEPCSDCAHLGDDPEGDRIIRGGGWNYGTMYLPAKTRTPHKIHETPVKPKLGVRCARDL